MKITQVCMKFGTGQHAFAEYEIRDGYPGETAPIPPPVDRPRPVQADPEPAAEALRKLPPRERHGARPLRMSPKTPDQIFLEQARALAEKTASNAAHVPFTAYFPTYSCMSFAQSQWYFYWRAKARSGEYIPADAPYIILYIFELINLVGCDAPREAGEHLRGLWRAYGEAIPRLNICLADWLKDLIRAQGLEITAKEAEELFGTEGKDLDRLLELKFREAPLRLELPLLSRLCGYEVWQSKFYRAGYSALCDMQIPKAIAAVDAYLRRRGGMGIGELYRPEVERNARYLFRGAPYALGPRLVQEETISYSTHKPLRDFLKALVRRAENRLREAAGFPGRLKEGAMEEDIGRVVDGFLATKPAPIVVTIDAERLLRAAEDAEETQRMLTIPEDAPCNPLGEAVAAEAVDDTAGEAGNMFLRPTGPEGRQRQSDAGEEIEAKTPSVYNTGSAEPGNVTLYFRWAAEDALHATVLQEKMTNGKLAAADPDGGAEMIRLQDSMETHNMQEIPDGGGAKGLEPEGALLYPQCTENIPGEYPPPEQTVSETPKPHDVDALGSGDSYPNEEQAQSRWQNAVSPWVEFGRQLTSLQRQLLAAMLQGADDRELQRLANAEGRMAEAELDGLNETAMAAVGDIIIENGRVLEEYADILSGLMGN